MPAERPIRASTRVPEPPVPPITFGPRARSDCHVISIHLRGSTSALAEVPAVPAENVDGRLVALRIPESGGTPVTGSLAPGRAARVRRVATHALRSWLSDA